MESRYEVDSKYIIGRSHQFCQDYALSGKEPFPYVIISDGCSSSPHTDVGARIICHTAKEVISICKPFAYSGNVMATSLAISRSMNLPIESLDATLGMIFILDDALFIKLYGDGIVIYKCKDCKGFIHISYDKNAPYYPSYLLSSKRKQQYKDMDIQLHKRLYEKYFHCPQYNRDIITDLPHTYQLLDDFSIDELEYVLIASDGLTSFMPEIPLEEVVELFTSFKSTKGEFIKRRAKRALKELAERGIYNQDDISIGGMLFNEG